MADVEAHGGALYGQEFGRKIGGGLRESKVFPAIKPAPDTFDLAAGQQILSPAGKALDEKLIARFREG